MLILDVYKCFGLSFLNDFNEKRANISLNSSKKTERFINEKILIIHMIDEAFFKLFQEMKEAEQAENPGEYARIVDEGGFEPNNPELYDVGSRLNSQTQLPFHESINDVLNQENNGGIRPIDIKRLAELPSGLTIMRNIRYGLANIVLTKEYWQLSKPHELLSDFMGIGELKRRAALETKTLDSHKKYNEVYDLILDIYPLTYPKGFLKREEFMDTGLPISRKKRMETLSEESRIIVLDSFNADFRPSTQMMMENPELYHPNPFDDNLYGVHINIWVYP